MLYTLVSFAAVGAATMFRPLISIVLLTPLKAAAVAGQQGSLWKEVGAVWLPGAGSAFSTVGMGGRRCAHRVWLCARLSRLRTERLKDHIIRCLVPDPGTGVRISRPHPAY